MNILTLFAFVANVLLIIFPGGDLFSQNYSRVEDELIVQTANVPIEMILSDLAGASRQKSENYKIRKFSHDAPFYLLKFDPGSLMTEGVLGALQEHPEISAVQFNHYLEQRRRPNDTEYEKQWPLSGEQSGIGIENAWNITTGGKIGLEKDIVIAIIDDGFQVDHPDLADNIYINHGEIPGNGIDDDGNGYVDDYKGWNFQTENDSLDAGRHGTSVAGIIGARGNNGEGIAGINWDIKILPLMMDERFTEAGLLAGYIYAYKLRKEFNDSLGERGAFVAATNSSWGTEGFFPDEFPIWCNVYDSLGTAGILNCVATSNRSINVETVGDLPSLCESESILVVTNSDKDQKMIGAFGPETVDIAAPGEDIFTLKKEGYGYDSGTSFAAPVVCGVLGLMYSIPVKGLLEKVMTAPQETAMEMKRILLENYDPVSSMEGKIKYPGIVNAYKAVSEAMLTFNEDSTTYCIIDSLDEVSFYLDSLVIGRDTLLSGNHYGYHHSGWLPDTLEQDRFIPAKIVSSTTNGTHYDFAIWMDMDRDSNFTDSDLLIAERSADRWSGEIYIPENIKPGSYNMRVGLLTPNDSLNACGEGIDSYAYEDFTVEIKENPLVCKDPPVVDTIMAGPDFLEIEWSGVDSSVAYIFRYRVEGTEDWEDEMVDTATVFTLEELELCTVYEFQVRSVCYYDTSAYSTSYFFATDCMTAAEDHDLSEEINIFPNPNNGDYLNIDLGEATAFSAGEISISMYSTAGREMYRGKQLYAGDRITISTGNLPSGLYLVRIQRGEKYAIKKLIVR